MTQPNGYTEIAGGSAKAVDDSLADLIKAYPDERRLEFVRSAVQDILREYGAAYRAEMEARCTAPIWQTKEGAQEREDLESCRRQVALLSAQLNSITDQQKEQWEREREVAWIEARWASLKRSAKMASRTFWITLALFLIALVGDAWAFFIAHGDGYLRFARDSVIGACILATVGGPFVIRAAWKDIRATESALEKFVKWHNYTSDVTKTD
ncbi:MAG TPA: hypothetical protein VK479_06915 [Micropepsaceae bacterium]|nr:hypothetical protein [Micropepsaceae bacterium]